MSSEQHFADGDFLLHFGVKRFLCDIVATMVCRLAAADDLSFTARPALFFGMLLTVGDVCA